MNAFGWTSNSNTNIDDYRNVYNDTSLPLGNVTVGGVATGNINYVGDKDVFAVTLSAGGHYVFNLDGTDTSSVYTLRDPYLRLLDSTGNVLATDDDISSSNWGSQLSYTATAGGTYYLEASSSPSDSSYTIGTYQIRAALSVDDYRNTYNDTSLPLGNVAIGGSATGTINYVGDRDVFAVTLTAGSHYSFNLDGTDTSSIYTLRDPYLQLLDSSGNVLASDDDIGSGNWSSEIDYTATTSGTYYLQASSSPTDASYTTGTYQVRASTPATLAIGGAATGEINYAGDKGTFAVTLAAGSHYTFNLDGTDTSSLYTLRDPYLRLLDSSGNVLASDDDISSSNWSSQFSYTATAGGTYYLQASSSPSDSSYTTGTYQIRAALSADDYRNTYNDTTLPLGSVTVGGVATGNINYIGDKDVFAVTLTAGGHYSFNLDGTDTSSVYTLRDPYLRLLDSSGNVLASDDDISSSDWSSQINYTATTGGTYYLEASSSPGDHSYTTGTYQLRATPTASASLVVSSQVDTSPSVVPVGSGNQSLTANAGAEIFDFSNLGFGSDTIAGFDPTKDVLRFSSSLVDSTSALRADMSSTAAGTLLTLDKAHSVMLSGVSSGSLTAANFQFV